MHALAVNMNPAAIAAATMTKTTEIRPKRATKKAGPKTHENHQVDASPTNRKQAAIAAQPNPAPLASAPNAADLLPTIPDAANKCSQPTDQAPHQEPHLTVDTLPAYAATPAITETVDQVINLHRQRQAIIKAKTKLILQAKAVVRSAVCTDADFEDDDTKADDTTAFGTKRRKLTKAATKRVDDAIVEAKDDPTSDFGLMVMPYLSSQEPLEARQAALEKAMVKLVKTLPAYQFAKEVKGFGDVSFATIVGECGDIGTYKSIAAVWKRMGLAVMSGNRQGNPGTGASAQDWIDHGYNRARRSVSWNARNGIILGMGKWRPLFGEDVAANPELTEYQRVFVDRARYEAAKLGLPVTESATGKESYKAHVVARAFRYTEKRLLKHLYLNWRRASAA